MKFLTRFWGHSPNRNPTSSPAATSAGSSQHRAEQLLQHSEQRFTELVAGVQDYAIFLLDDRGHVVTWNAGAERIKGYRAEEIIGQHLSRFYPQEANDSHWPEQELAAAADQGRFEDEGWRIRNNGSKFWANVVITALRDDQGELLGFLKITRDLTERMLAEENARRLLREEVAREAAESGAQEAQKARDDEHRQRAQLQVTLSSIGDAVIVTDMHGLVTFLNPVAVELTGWTPQEAAGQPLNEVFNIINEETRKAVENPVTKVLRDGVIVGLANHTVLLSKDGREIPIDDSGAPIRGEDGSIAGVVLVFRDVSESRRAIEARLHLAAIVESSDDAIIGKSLNGMIVSWNRGAERLYGYTADEIVGKPISTLVPADHPDELPRIMTRIRQGEFIEHFETVRIRKDGGRVDVSLTISPVRDSEGKVIGASKIARDITARKEEDRRKNEFLALLAHELRNPLAAVRSGLEVIRLAEIDSEAAQEVRSVMERQLQHLMRLVDDLLDVSRISRGALGLRREVLPLSTVVHSALETCTSIVRQGNHPLSSEVTDEPIHVNVDKTRLAQAVCNLISNAAKYSDDGTPIQLTAAREGDEAVIRVTDSGVGIAPHMLDKVFEMFTQVDQSLEKSQNGLGVGLSIVQQLIEMHGGKVEAHSAGLGHGSEFVLRLPLAESPDQQAPQENVNPTQPGIPAQYRVLVVDDNVDAANTLGKILKLMGNDVLTAHDGLQGIESATKFRPHLILLDIGMPRLNGYEACRRIRKLPWGRDVAIAALTGWGQEEDILQSREAGFDHHLVKPVEPEVLRQLLSELKAPRM